MPNRKTSSLTLYALFACAYVISALYGMSYFFQNSALGDAYFRTRFDIMVDGRAPRPFVYRQLVPMMVRAVDQVTPEAVRQAVTNGVERLKAQPEDSSLRSFLPWLNNSFPATYSHYKRVLASLLIFASLVGFMAAMFALARALLPDEPAVALFAPIFGVLAFTSFGYQWQYIYDIPCLCLSTACFYFMYKQQFRIYLLLFFLYCLNKETSVFVLIFFALWHWNRLENKRFVLLWNVQCAIFILVKVLLIVSYMDNPGVILERNMSLVLVRDLLAETNVDRILHIMTIFFLLLYGWQNKPLFLKKTLWLFPMFYVAYFCFGFPGEYRVFFDLFGPLTLLATHTLLVGTGLSQSPVFAQLPFFTRKTHASGA